MFYVDRKIEVRYAETDMMGVVYHGNYIVWMEIGRTAFLTALGYNYKDMEDSGVQAPITNVNITYKTPVKYGDDVFIRTWVKKSSPFRTIYRSIVFNSNGEICVDAECQAACVDKDSFKLVSFKKYDPVWYETYQQIAVGDDEEKIIKNSQYTVIEPPKKD